MLLRLALGVLLLTSAAHSLDILASDPRIYHTEYNWYVDKSVGALETANPGAYIKVDFTGSAIGINLDTPLLSFPYGTLAWSVDDGPEQNIQMPSPGESLQLASNLDKSKTHSLYLFVKNVLQGQDRWNGPDVRIRIMNFTIDDGSTVMAPKLAPKRLLAYWDSIGEGVAVNGANGDLASNDAHVTWAYSFAQAINTEFSVVAWGAQGYTIGGMGNTPALWNSDGQANTSGWKWLSSKYARDFSVCPDYIINGHGTNDGVRGQHADQVTINAMGWLNDVRQTCPSSKIFVVIPFGRFMEDAIVKAYQAYQASTPDQSTILIQLGDRASKGLTNGGPSFEAVDGVHPWAWKSSQLGAMLAAEIAPHLSPKKLSLNEFLEI